MTPDFRRVLTRLALLLFLLPVAMHAERKTTKPQAPAAAKPQAQPDVIVFTNGDHITGQMERIVGKNLIFKSDMAGEITVSLDKVKELRSSGSYALIRSEAVHKVHFDRASIPTGTVSYDDKKLTIADPMGEAETVEPGKIAYVIDQQTFDRDVARKAHWNEGWTGSLTGGATLVRATQNNETLTGAVNVQRLVPTVTWLPKSDRTIFNMTETYGKVTQVGTPDVLTSIFHAGGENDHYVSARFYDIGDFAYDHNYSQGLQFQESYGGGMGWTAIQKPSQQLDLKADLHYLGQYFLTLPGATPTPNQQLVGTALTETYKRTLPHKIVVTQALSASPAWNYETAFTANASVGLNIPVYKRFSMTLSTSDSFLNDPAPGYNKNSFTTVTGISYTLK